MRKLLTLLTLTALIPLCSATLVGCSGGATDEVLDYDPKVSEQKRAEYEQQMREGMQKGGRPGAGPPAGTN